MTDDDGLRHHDLCRSRFAQPNGWRPRELSRHRHIDWLTAGATVSIVIADAAPAPCAMTDGRLARDLQETGDSLGIADPDR